MIEMRRNEFFIAIRPVTEFCVFSVTCEFEFGSVFLIMYHVVTNSALCFHLDFIGPILGIGFIFLLG